MKLLVPFWSYFTILLCHRFYRQLKIFWEIKFQKWSMKKWTKYLHQLISKYDSQSLSFIFCKIYLYLYLYFILIKYYSDKSDRQNSVRCNSFWESKSHKAIFDSNHFHPRYSRFHWCKNTTISFFISSHYSLLFCSIITFNTHTIFFCLKQIEF